MSDGRNGRRLIDPTRLVSVPEIAAAFGVSLKSAYRWAELADFPQPVAQFGKKFRVWLLPEVKVWHSQRPPGGPAAVEHGLSGYQRRRCRCDVCRAASTAMQRVYRAKRRAERLIGETR